MTHKTNTSKTAAAVVSVQLTQADAVGAKGQALSNTRIYIIDANGVPTGAIMESGIAGAVPVSGGGGSGAPAIVPLWTAATALDAGAQVRATVAVGGFIVGEYISSNSSRTTGATFGATEAAFFTSVPEDTTIAKKTDLTDGLALKMNQYQQGHPFHTAATQAGHVVTGTSEFAAQYAPWSAFQASPTSTSEWATAGAASASLTYQLPQATIFNRVVLMGRLNVIEYPTTWSIAGSNDGSDFSAVLVASHAESLQAEVTKDFVNTTAYKYYRFAYTAGAGTNIGLNRIRFFHAGLNYLPVLPAGTVINNTLTSTSTTEALSAAQGKVLQDTKAPITSLTDGSVASYFDTLKFDRSISVSSTDLNNITVSGFYDGSNVTNRPTGGTGDWFFVQHYQHSNTGDLGWAMQMAKGLNPVTGIYSRSKTSGTWGAWALHSEVGHVHANATISVAGFMSAADKVILDGLPASVALKAPIASPTLTGTITADGTVRLGDGQNVGDSGTAATGSTNVFPPAAATAVTTIASTDIGLRVVRPGTSGTKWGNALDISIGSHTAGLNSQSQVDFRLNNGATATPDMTALTLRGDGQVILSSNPTAALGAATKQYVDGLTVGLLDYRGAFTPAVASGATGYPTTGGSGSAGAILKGDVYFASAAGFILTEAIQAGDSVLAKIDAPGQTAANWDKLNVNISYVPENAANKRATFQAVPTDTAYPTEKLLKDNIDIINASLSAKANALNPIQVYSAASLYPLGYQVVQASRLYTCTTAITVAEAFNATKWTEISPTPTFATSLRLMNPADIIEDANRAIYLLADDLALGAVATWANPGTGGDFTQATGASQPTVVAVPALGNRRAALFADDFMESANINLGTNYGLFAVFMITSLAEQNQFILSETYSGGTVEFTFGVQGSQFFSGHFNGAWRQHVVGTPVVATPYILATGYNGASISIAVNGGTVSTAAQTSNPALSELGPIRLGRRWDGGTDIFDGHIACVVAKSGSAFTATELAQLEGWAAWYYGRVSALPVGHTYKTVPPMITA